MTEHFRGVQNLKFEDDQVSIQLVANNQKECFHEGKECQSTKPGADINYQITLMAFCF